MLQSTPRPAQRCRPLGSCRPAASTRHCAASSAMLCDAHLSFGVKVGTCVMAVTTSSPSASIWTAAKADSDQGHLFAQSMAEAGEHLANLQASKQAGKAHGCRHQPLAPAAAGCVGTCGSLFSANHCSLPAEPCRARTPDTCPITMFSPSSEGTGPGPVVISSDRLRYFGSKRKKSSSSFSVWCRVWGADGAGKAGYYITGVHQDLHKDGFHTCSTSQQLTQSQGISAGTACSSSPHSRHSTLLCASHPTD